MIVEVFYKGTYFTNLYDTFWNIKKIETSGGLFILVSEHDGQDNITLDCDEYELRVTY